MVMGDKDGMLHLIRLQEGTFSVKAMGTGCSASVKRAKCV